MIIMKTEVKKKAEGTNPKSWDEINYSIVMAIAEDDVATLEKILSTEKIDVNTYEADVGGATLLHIAAECTAPRSMRLLRMKGADPDKKDEYGATPKDIVRENAAIELSMITPRGPFAHLQVRSPEELDKERKSINNFKLSLLRALR